MFGTTERAHQVKAFATKHDDLSSIHRAQMVKEKDYSCKWSSAWVHITHTHAHRHAHTPTHMCARTHTEVHTLTKETNECNSNKKISVPLHLAAKLGQGIGYGECCPRSSQRCASFRTKGTTLVGTSPVPHSMSSMLKTKDQPSLQGS